MAVSHIGGSIIFCLFIILFKYGSRVCMDINFLQSGLCCCSTGPHLSKLSSVLQSWESANYFPDSLTAELQFNFCKPEALAHGLESMGGGKGPALLSH